MDVPQIPGYDVLARIGVGASAQVWRARRVADDLDVALKIVPTGPEHVSAALREAGFLARVRHQHLIHLYDVLPVPQADGRPGGVALAMELAGGGSLAEVLGARTHLTPGELVTVCSPLAGALAELHRTGVVHGDISPGNVLFRSDGMPLLADLGVSRVVGERRGETYGTDGMVAPEVLEGFPPSSESDVYAMGALAWHCLVGEVPGWVGTRVALDELRPELPEALVELVTACVAPEPSDRPEAEELAVALFAAARPEPVELAPGADPAAGLTQRIRADLRGRALGEDPTSGDDEAAGGEARRGTHPRALRGTQPRTASPRALHRAPRGRARSSTGRALGGVTMGLLALMVVVGLAVPCGRATAFDRVDALTGGGRAQVGATAAVARTAAPGGEPGSGPESVATDDEPTAAETTGGESVSEAVDRAVAGDETPPDPESAGEDLTAVNLEPERQPDAAAQHLLDARASAWRSGDPDDLAAAHAPDSPAYVQEAAALASAREQEVRYQGLAFRVEDAAVLAAQDERVVLEVAVVRSAFEEVTPE